MKTNILHLGDNIEVLKTFPDNSVDCIITDSPYGLGKEPDAMKVLPAWVEFGFYAVEGRGFMGKKWDAFVPQPLFWKECYRVLKPGCYCLSFFGTRTYDWGAMAMRLAGFQVRDQIDWIYGSGFPKSKASLKPAHEPIAVCRKPGLLRLLNIDECRIDLNGDFKGGDATRTKGIGELQNEAVYGKAKRSVHDNSVGRWPANVILDQDTAELLDEQSGWSNSARKSPRIEKTGNSVISKHGGFGIQGGRPIGFITHGFNDNGGASRFFYCAKASPSERAGSKHPTIKPLKLIIHLVKLFCPEGGICLDPHEGQGTHAEACILTNRPYIGIDNDPVSIADAEKRVAKHNDLFTKTV